MNYRYVSNTIENNNYKMWLLCNMTNETEICDLASAMIDVLTKVCGKDEDELECEWMSMSFDRRTNSPNFDGVEEWFDKYSDEVLESLWSLDESSYDIFNFVEKEEIKKPYYGSGDDGFASAMFPVRDYAIQQAKKHGFTESKLNESTKNCWEDWYKALSKRARYDDNIDAMQDAIDAIDNIHEDVGAFKNMSDDDKVKLNDALDVLAGASDYELYQTFEDMCDYFGFNEE